MADSTEMKQELKTYQGNCHCGAYKYSLKVPEITSAMTCNCSICAIKGYNWIFPHDEGAFKVERDGELKVYEFGKKSMEHKFCAKCGTPVLAIVKARPEGKNVGLNARSIMDLGVWGLKTDSFDGAAMGDAYQKPEPTEHDLVAAEGEKVYTGNCHCGAVKIAIKTKPLPEQLVQRCNCSICIRNANVLFYPWRNDLVVSDPNATTMYSWGLYYLGHRFCSTCGTPVYIEMLPKMEETMKEKSEEDKKFAMNKVCINANIINDAEWDKIKIGDCLAGERGPKYTVD